MADNGSVTTTGLEEFKRAVQQLPKAVTDALKTVAHRSAQAIAGDAARRLRAQQKTEAHALADAIEVIEDAPNNQFIVRSNPPAGQPAAITIWNEHGTIHMAPRPYMRPSADAGRVVYERESEAAAVNVVSEALE